MVDIIAILMAYGLLGLFAVNFLSSSIIPLPSEPAIFLATAVFDPLVVLIVTVAGAMLGSITNYYIGYKGIRKLFHIFKREVKKEKQAKPWIEKYGLWSLLIVQWVPIIGDPIMVLMGLYKVNFKKFLIFLFIGEFIKAFSIIYLGFYFFNYF
jgi:membrane protein YqaA with SNARE-associated domain